MGKRLTSQRVGVGAIVAYVLVVTGLSTAQRVVGAPSIGSITLTPQLFAHGKLWLLLTSGFLVSGAIGYQVLMLSILAFATIRRRGVGRFWAAAVAGHVGSTVVTYAALGVLILAHANSVQRLVSQSDYGISCIWAGALGALSTDAFLSARTVERVRVTALAVCVMAVVTALSNGLALPEHLLAFLFGALVVLLPRRERASASPGVACAPALPPSPAKP